jgi:hypothetical protein
MDAVSRGRHSDGDCQLIEEVGRVRELRTIKLDILGSWMGKFQAGAFVTWFADLPEGMGKGFLDVHGFSRHISYGSCKGCC